MGLFDKYLERKLEKMIRAHGNQKATAGFMMTEIENDPAKYAESAKRTDYKDFIDSFNNLPWLYAGAMALAIASTKPKLKIYQNMGEDQKEISGKDINRLFIRPNDFISWRELLQITVINLAIPGNHYWNLVGTQNRNYPNIVIDKTNPPVEIWWMKPEQVEIKPDPEKFIKYYEFRSSNTEKPEKLHPSEVIHFKLPNPDSYFRGMGSMQPAKNTAILEFNAISYNKNFFKNDAMPPWIFDFPDRPTDPQLETYKRAWNERHRGSGKAGKFGYIYGGTKIQELGKLPKDAQYAEMRKMNREEMLACLPGSVPPSIVGLLEYANYSNMEVQSKKFWEDCAIPILDLIADKLTLNLAPHFDDSYYFVFDYSNIKVLQEDEERKSKVASALIRHGIKTPNQIRREMYNDDPYPEGNRYFMEMGLVEAGVDTGDKTGKARALPPHKKISFWQDKTKKKILWDSFVKRVDKQTEKFSKRVEEYLKDQAKIVEDALSKFKEPSEIKASKLFDTEKEIDRYINRFQKDYAYMLQEGGEAGLRATEGKLYTMESKQVFKDEGPFRMTPELKAQLEQMVIHSGTTINETTMAKILELLEMGIVENWTVPEFAKNIKEKLADLAISRAKRIARTESAKVDNWGQTEGYKQNEFIERKGWLSAFAPESRDEHVAASDQVVNLNEPFIVGGEELQYPGDPAGSPGNIINCLCSTYPEVGEI